MLLIHKVIIMKIETQNELCWYITLTCLTVLLWLNVFYKFTWLSMPYPFNLWAALTVSIYYLYIVFAFIWKWEK